MPKLYNRYTDKLNRLFCVVGFFKEINEQNEAVAETPSFIKLLIVNEEKTQTIPYPEFLSFVANNHLKQIV